MRLKSKYGLRMLGDAGFAAIFDVVFEAPHIKPLVY